MIMQIIWIFVSVMLYFFFAVAAHRLFTKIHSPYNDRGESHWHTSDIQGTNFAWAVIWPISLPIGLFYCALTSNFAENSAIAIASGFDYVVLGIARCVKSIYNFYNRILDRMFMGKI